MKQTYFITNLQSLPHVTLSGSVSVPAPNKHFRRTPSDWILYFITNGSMLLQEEDTIYHLSAGQTLLLCPDKCHFGVQSNSPVSYYYIHFQWNPQKNCCCPKKKFITNFFQCIVNLMLPHYSTNHANKYLFQRMQHFQELLIMKSLMKLYLPQTMQYRVALIIKA